MVSVKLFLYVVYTTLPVVDITCSVDDVSGLVGAPVAAEAAKRAAPTCTIRQLTVSYCISVYDGKPVLRVLAEIISGYWTIYESPTFLLSYKSGTPLVVKDPQCIGYYCKGLFIIDWEDEKVNINSAIKVTASVEDCSSSTVEMISGLRNNQIVDITLGEVMDTTATIVCKLSCFTKEIGCIPVDTNLTFHTSNITGDPNSYRYRSQKVTVTNLASGNTYNVCVSAYNLTTTELQGIVLCEVFTTHRHHKGNDVYENVIVTTTFVLILAVIFIVAIISCYCLQKKCRVCNQAVPSVEARMNRGQGDEPSVEIAGVPSVEARMNRGQGDEPLVEIAGSNELIYEDDEPEVNIVGSDDEGQLIQEVEDEALSDNPSGTPAE